MHMLRRVLLVDDDESITDFIVAAVTMKGCDIKAFNSRDDALEYIRQEGFPDLILLDI